MTWSFDVPSKSATARPQALPIDEPRPLEGAPLVREPDARVRWPTRRRASLRLEERLRSEEPLPLDERVQSGGSSPAPRTRDGGGPRWRAPLRVLGALFVVHLMAFNLSVVRGSSMAPGIHDGDRILIDQVSYLFSSVGRGDVVVMRYPLDPRLDYIKRVVGLPGDSVTISDGCVRINGEALPEPYISRPDRSVSLDVRVREGHYFVMGDNRPHSSDSREFGQVPAEYLRGRVDVRVWPPARIGWIH